MSPEIRTADELATITGANRMLSEPYPRRLVARDQANQGAALLITSAGYARELGVLERKFVYLHGGADARERMPMERQDLSRSPAAVQAVEQALTIAGVGIDRIDLFDLYSCFPIAVSNILDGYGLSGDDPRPLTVAGGLPFFGGAGNNYSMHAIAGMVRALRKRPGERGLVGANGGFLSKYSVGVYSTEAAPWLGIDNRSLQAGIDAEPAVPVRSDAKAGRLETYTIDYSGPKPKGIVIGRASDDGARFVAMTDPDDDTVVQAMIAHDPFGSTVEVAPGERGRTLITSLKAA